jgi:hypothetical protein
MVNSLGRSEAYEGKHPGKWHNFWTLHHNNYPASTNTTVIPHSPYSPDLAPCDFLLVPKMKLKLKG